MINKVVMPKAYIEVLEILKYIPKSDYNKIPSEIIQFMKLNSDKNYKYEIINFKNFQEQKMLKETETILAIFYRDYWATEEQRRRILENERLYLYRLDKIKREKYDPSNLFKKNKNVNGIQ